MQYKVWASWAKSCVKYLNTMTEKLKYLKILQRGAIQRRNEAAIGIATTFRGSIIFNIVLKTCNSIKHSGDMLSITLNIMIYRAES